MSSTISKATTLHFSKTFFNNSKVGYHCKPPGSGVPVEGAIDGSKASKSIGFQQRGDGCQ